MVSASNGEMIRISVMRHHLPTFSTTSGRITSLGCKRQSMHFISRLLTHPADVLDAFAGISNVLNFLSSAFEGAGSSSNQSNEPAHFTSVYN